MRCGKQHAAGRDACPAMGQRCKVCGNTAHFLVVCKSKKKHAHIKETSTSTRKSAQDRKKVHAIDTDYAAVAETKDSPSFDTMMFKEIHFDHVSLRHASPSSGVTQVFATIDFFLDNNGGPDTHLKGKIDTGAKGNILPLRLFRWIFPAQVDRNSVPRKGALQLSTAILLRLVAAQIYHFGVCTILCGHKGKLQRTHFFVTDRAGPAIFGLPMVQKLELFSISVDTTHFSFSRDHQSSANHRGISRLF